MRRPRQLEARVEHDEGGCEQGDKGNRGLGEATIALVGLRVCQQHEHLLTQANAHLEAKRRQGQCHDARHGGQALVIAIPEAGEEMGEPPIRNRAQHKLRAGNTKANREPEVPRAVDGIRYTQPDKRGKENLWWDVLEAKQPGLRHGQGDACIGVERPRGDAGHAWEVVAERPDGSRKC